ncbi:MAG: efflux RND transporter periplasmic adaptor subunit [bacterium]
MSDKNNSKGALIIGLIVGALLSALVVHYVIPVPAPEGVAETSQEKKVEYWVAPMDANYRRDKPGKSPMGMDLIPVYADGGLGNESGVGTVRISPDVVNNLGVRTEVVDYGPLNTEIKTVGYIAYDEDRMVHVHSRVKGWIEKLYVKAAGDPVEKGQPLYEIYSPELVNAQEELVLALSRKNSSLIRAAKDRLGALQIPTKEIKQIIKSRKVKQNITYYAPQNGYIDKLEIREGFYVTPMKTILSVVALDDVWVEAEVFERQAGLIEKGLSAQMKIDFIPGRSWSGEIDYVYPALNTKSRTLTARIRFENEDRKLKPNMFASIVIQGKHDAEVLRVVKEAVIRSGQTNRVVLALGDGKFKSINVELGRFGKDYVEVLSGLAEGDKVVSSAQFLIDSESSKTSDFKRMNHGDDDMAEQVQVEGTINSVMPEHGMINVSHQEIPEWDWPDMTMDFSVADGIDLSDIAEGDVVQMVISKQGDQYTVTDLFVPEVDLEAITAEVDGTVNSIMKEHGMLNISREAIEKWGRPAATLDFMVAKDVDLSQIESGMRVRFTFMIQNGEFIISKISPIEEMK